MLLFPSPLTGVVMAMVEIFVWHSPLVLSCTTRRQHVLSSEVSDSKTIVADSRPTTRIRREAVSALNA
jgi:hypothetical protein